MIQSTADDVNCEQCSTRNGQQTKTRQNDVTTLGFNSTVNFIDTKCLIVSLPVFGDADQRGRAQRRQITVSHFDCNDIQFTQKQGTEQVSWRVMAVVCHQGTTTGGHFWAWRRIPNTDKSFAEISDETITGEVVDYDTFDKITNVFLLYLARNVKD